MLLPLLAVALLSAAPASPSSGGAYAADDLRGLYLRGEQEIYYSPTESIVIDEDTDLSGVFVVDTFEIRDGAIVVAVDDLTIIARRVISIDGDVVGADRLEVGVRVVLRSFGPTYVSGTILSGSGLSPMEGQVGFPGRGGDLVSRSTFLRLDGYMVAGAGSLGEPGFDGGDGGHAIVIAEYAASLSPGAPSELIAGEGGDAGVPAGWQMNGNDGGDGGNARIVQSVDSLDEMLPFAIVVETFEQLSLTYSRAANAAANPAGATAMALLYRQTPEPTPCEAGKGDSGTPTIAPAGGLELGSDMSPNSSLNGEDCSGGSDQAGGGAAGGNYHFGTTSGEGAGGGDGTAGKAGNSPKGDGGDGGHGGHGGDATGGKGQQGGHGGSCCPSGYGGNGGKGGPGGAAQAGSGGQGGDAGTATGDCNDGTPGQGGNGGNSKGGRGGAGGWAGASGGTDPSRYPSGGPGGDSGGSTCGNPGNDGDFSGIPYAPPGPCGSPNEGNPGYPQPPPHGDYGDVVRPERSTDNTNEAFSCQ